MEGVAVTYLILAIVIVVFGIGSFLALPWIWYHAGQISRKLDKIISLLEKRQ